MFLHGGIWKLVSESRGQSTTVLSQGIFYIWRLGKVQDEAVEDEKVKLKKLLTEQIPYPAAPRELFLIIVNIIVLDPEIPRLRSSPAASCFGHNAQTY